MSNSSRVIVHELKCHEIHYDKGVSISSITGPLGVQRLKKEVLSTHIIPLKGRSIRSRYFAVDEEERIISKGMICLNNDKGRTGPFSLAIFAKSIYFNIPKSVFEVALVGDLTKGSVIDLKTLYQKTEFYRRSKNSEKNSEH